MMRYQTIDRYPVCRSMVSGNSKNSLSHPAKVQKNLYIRTHFK